MVQEAAAELVEPSLQAWGGAADPEGGDDVAARAVHGDGDAGQPDLELVGGHRPPALAGAGAVAAQRRAVGQRGGRELLERAVRYGERVPRVEDLAERGHVRRDLDLGPVPGAEEEGRVDLGDLHHAVAAGDAQVHGLARGLPDRVHRRTGEADQVVPRVVARGVQPEEPAGDVGPAGVPLEQAGPLERGEHPRGRRLRQSARVLDVGEAHRLVGVDHGRDQVRGAVERPGAGGGVGHEWAFPSGSMMWNGGSTS